jgi:hypothetical protein
MECRLINMGANIIKETNALQNTSGIWNLQGVFKAVEAGNWTNS